MVSESIRAKLQALFPNLPMDEDHEFYLGFADGLKEGGVSESYAEVALEAILRARERQAASEAHPEPSAVPEPPQPSGEAPDANGVTEPERERLRALFWKAYRQVTLVSDTSLFNRPAILKHTRPMDMLCSLYPGIERTAVREMQDSLHELGPEEYKLLNWWFFSGGTLEELRKLPPPGDA